MLLAGLWSCSLLTSLDGFSGDAPLPDGGAEADASRDAPVAEAGDAPDARPDGNADAGFSCALLSPAPRLCVDFGQGRVHSGGVKTATDFEGQTVLAIPAPRLDTAELRSPPASALFELSSTNTRSYLYRTFGGITPARVELAESMRIEAPDAASLDLMEIRFGDIDAAIYLTRAGDVLRIVESYGLADGGRQSLAFPLPVTMPAARWMRLAWVVETGPSPTLTILIDGATVLDKKPLAPFTSAGGVTFIAGCTDATPVGDVKIRVDDVVANF